MLTKRRKPVNYVRVKRSREENSDHGNWRERWGEERILQGFQAGTSIKRK
jgi:hypothetical protein